MTYKKVGSDRAKHEFLKTFAATADAEAAASRPIVPANLSEQARSLSASFKANMDMYQKLYADRRQAVSHRKVELETLQSLVRHFWNNVQRNAKRNGDTGWKEARYKLHVSKPIPTLTRREDWISAAQELIAGELEIIEGGGAAMSNPSADELEIQLAQTVSAGRRVTDIKNALTNLRQSMDAERRAIERFQRETARFFRYTMGERKASVRREVMRTYGFTFLASPNNSEDHVRRETIIETNLQSGGGVDRGNRTGDENDDVDAADDSGFSFEQGAGNQARNLVSSTGVDAAASKERRAEAVDETGLNVMGDSGSGAGLGAEAGADGSPKPANQPAVGVGARADGQFPSRPVYREKANPSHPIDSGSADPEHSPA